MHQKEDLDKAISLICDVQNRIEEEQEEENDG